MSTSFGWEGKGRYGSICYRMNAGYVGKKTVRSLENTCHTWVPYRCVTTRRYTNLPVPLPLHYSPTSVSEDQLWLEWKRQVWFMGVQVKLGNPLRTRATPEHLRGVFRMRHYTNPRYVVYLYLTFLVYD